MLYLDAPYYFINGVSVFRDHADPLQFYYLPAQPRLRTELDPGTGKRVPRLQLIKYRSLVAGAGGFLTFDVHIGLSDDEIDAVAGEIRRMAHLPEKPRLIPVQPLDGSVRLLILGQDSGATPPPARPGVTPPPPAPPRFVLKVAHFAKPSLYGDNGAAFAVELDEQGAAIVTAAMKGEITPIIVVYSITFAALRPAFSVRLHIDWDRVQTSMDETFGHESYFTSTQIENAVDKLVENRVIQMEADNFVPDADDAGKAVSERFESARMRVQEMITDSFFEASLPPNKERPDGWDKAVDVLDHFGKQAGMMAATGGIGGFIGTFSYNKSNYQRIDKRKLDVEISERSAIIRTIYPQGTVSGLFRALHDGVDPARFILEVDADDPWFAHRKVRVINRGEMTRDELASVNATLTYGQEVRSAVLEETGKEVAVEWLSILENGGVKRPVSVDYTVLFKPDAGGERPLEAASGPHEITGDVLELQPAELYARITVPIIASPGYPWDKYPQVQVMLRYLDPANGIKTDDTLIVKSGGDPQSWTFVALDKANRAFKYRLLHQAANHEDVDSGWIDSDGDMVDIRDPFGTMRLSVDVVPVVARWDDVEQIFVDLTYSDPDNGVDQSGSLAFSPDDRTPKKFVVDRKDRTKKLVGFTVTTILKGGMVLEVPRSFTESPRILVRTDMKGHRIIAVTSPADFAKPKLERVEVDLAYTDVEAGIDVADSAAFDDPGGRKTFEFDYVDAARNRYRWRAKYLFLNGMTQQTEWADADGDTLAIKAI
ncbi:MAG: hypothetical protein ACOH2H_25375 [Cypionkella sp.]